MALKHTFKHIRTSILPFGYNDKTKAYKFSLCIDLNPNYTAESEEFQSSREALEHFIREYAVTDNNNPVAKDTVFGLLTEAIPKLHFFAKRPAPPASGEWRWKLCHQDEIIAHVSPLWKAFLRMQPQIISTSELPQFIPPMDLSATNVTSLFDNKNGAIPAPKKVREQAVALFEKENKMVAGTTADYEKLQLDYRTKLQSEIDKFNNDIKKFSAKLDGMTEFATGQNEIQSHMILGAYNQRLHHSIFDSVDAMQEIWAFIDSNILLQRLMGKTIDFEVPEEAFANYQDGELFDLQFPFDKQLIDKTARNNKVLQWEHLATPVKIYRELNLMIIAEHDMILKEKEEIRLEAQNYDVGGKLIGLKSISDKYKNYMELLADPTKKESEKYLIRKQLIALDTAALTIGINTYNTTLTTILKDESTVENILRDHYESHSESGSKPPPNFLYRIKKGYTFAVRSNFSEDNPLTPIGRRKTQLKFNKKNIKLPEEFKFEDFAISTTSGSHAIIQETNAQGITELKSKVIQDEAMLNWFGENISMPSVFSNQEDETNFEAQINEGSMSEATKFVSEKINAFYLEDYIIKGVDYIANEKVKNSIVNYNTTPDKPVTIQYTLKDIENKKLVFGRKYQLILTPQYKNGWGIPFEKVEKLKQLKAFLELKHYYVTVENFTFKRNEPIKPVEIFLSEPLIDGKGNPTTDRDGETLDHLAIRNKMAEESDQVGNTRQNATRYVLPPAISFQQAFWYNKIFEMSDRESHQWYLKYHFPKAIGKRKFNDKFKFHETDVYELDDIDEIIEGSTEMRPNFPDKWYIPDYFEKNNLINYLPDPLSKGFRLEFFLDKNRTIKAPEYEKYENLEFYFSGDYPIINAWKIILTDFRGGDEYVYEDGEEIYIKIEKGKELYISARTILDEKYESQFETFGNYNDFTRYGGNDLLTPPLDFSVVHAVQRPLVRPKFHNILAMSKDIGKTNLQMAITADIEQTNIHYDPAGIVKYLDDTLPTGNIELYAKWEIYKDDPNHIVADDYWTPDSPVNKVDSSRFDHDEDESAAVFETTVAISGQLENMQNTLNKTGTDENDSRNYMVDLKIAYDVRDTAFIEKYYWIKNKSKFTSYYPKDWGQKEHLLAGSQEESREYFNKTSDDAFLVRILNSKKPAPPILADKNISLVSVTEDFRGRNVFYRKSSMNRLRFFFERGRLTSGKGEKIGFVVNEPASKYNDYLIGNGLVSIVGRDILSDTVKPYDGLFRNEDVLLTKANFITHDPYQLRDLKTKNKSDDLESFYPEYVPELGIMTYKPKFDRKSNLWYLDVEVDINNENGQELHSPFLRFSIVHYQEHSINQNTSNTSDLTKDCRISEINKSGFVYIMPSRKIEIHYNEYKNGRIKLKLGYDLTSLKNGEPESNRSKFYALIRHKRPIDAKWYMADRNAIDDKMAFYRIENEHFQTNELHFKYYTNTDYQIVILETEDWGNNTDDSFDRLIENRKSRIVHTSTFELFD